jgi:SAM-dependent methyltransferase
MDEHQSFVASILMDQNIRRVIEVGCAKGYHTKFLCRFSNAQGIDISAPYIKEAKKLFPDIKFQVADAKTFKVSRKFDAVVTHGLFIHIDPKDIKKTIKNVMNMARFGIFTESSAAEYLTTRQDMAYNDKKYWTHRALHPKENEDLPMKYCFKHDYETIFEELGLVYQIVKVFDHMNNTRLYFVRKGILSDDKKTLN